MTGAQGPAAPAALPVIDVGPLAGGVQTPAAAAVAGQIEAACRDTSTALAAVRPWISG